VTGCVDIEIHDGVAEGLARKPALVQQIGGFGENLSGGVSKGLVMSGYATIPYYAIPYCGIAYNEVVTRCAQNSLLGER
jgi:hypothetical protein